MSSAASHRGGDGSPLVLIHGFSDTWRGWSPVLEPLERHHDVLASTLAGHFEGNPLPTGTAASVSALVDAIEHDMDEAGFETAHLVGNSLGGWIALELAARGRARSVVALAPAGGWERNTPQERRLVWLFKANLVLAKRTQHTAEKTMRRPGIRKLALGAVARHPERIPPAAAAHMVRGAANCDVYLPLLEHLTLEGFAESLSPIDVPVRIAWSEYDRILYNKPAYTKRMERIVPDAETIVLRGVGHCPMYDDPDLVVRTVLEVTAPVDAAAEAGEPEPEAAGAS